MVRQALLAGSSEAPRFIHILLRDITHGDMRARCDQLTNKFSPHAGTPSGNHSNFVLKALHWPSSLKLPFFFSKRSY
jgi:hypothetical protein